MENLVMELSKLHILLVRNVERHSHLKCVTHRDVERIIMSGKFTVTYKEAVENLYNTAIKFSKNQDLIDKILKLKEEINNSEIADLRFGTEPTGKFTEIENKLDSIVLQKRFEMLTNMITLAEASELTEIPVTTIKNACLDERLLNVRKSGRTWLVNLLEIKEYWNIEDK